MRKIHTAQELIGQRPIYQGPSGQAVRPRNPTFCPAVRRLELIRSQGCFSVSICVPGEIERGFRLTPLAPIVAPLVVC
jgi:hypothetical protein